MVIAKKEEKGDKRTQISQAQQYMVLAVLGASLFLGAAIAVIVHSINKISFSANVIVAQDQSITSFSDVIKNIGICSRPSGQVYSDSELQKCSPNNVNVSAVPNTLRSNILNNIASNEALASVPNESDAGCNNPDTGKNYTYQELEERYSNAESEEEVAAAIGLIKTCSSLRVIPDALPAYKNEEALLASVDKIFNISDARLQSLSPTDEIDGAPFGVNLYTISVRLALEGSTDTVHRLLNNLERSIRNFNIDRATINWSSNGSIDLTATASAYYMTPSTLMVTDKSISIGGRK
ncbi:hypothetical protein IKG07_02515 [Candidatus Saccharibacteria bacterium]|nr:hypothetical protein [Candidatus Saccharibacteria bacterium]